MNIMIDYDNTFAADSQGWKEVITLMQTRGHEFYLVTSRDMETRIDDMDAIWFQINSVPIVYCAWRAKETVCREQGIKIDIWIDDDPLYITKGFIE